MSNVDIWCIIRDNRSVFYVTIGTTNNIFDLKVSIKDRKPNYFAKLDADDLILWSVNVASNVLKNKDTDIAAYLNDELKDETGTVGNTFQNVGGSNIRVVVGVCVTEQPGPTDITLKDIGNKVDLMRAEILAEMGSVYEISARHEIEKINGIHYSSKFEISDLNGADITLKDIGNKVDLMRAEILAEMGSVYEISARHEIEKINGIHYSSKFEISDLNGLVRLALPRKKLLSEHPEYGSQISVQVNRVDKIANYIYKNNMRAKLQNSITYIRSLPQDNNYNKNLHCLADRAEKVLSAWKDYEKKSNGSSKNRLYLANTPYLSIMLITSHILDAKLATSNDQAPFNEVLELDIRGKATSYLDINNVSIEIGEIKLSSKNIFHGYRQLLLRLASLGFVIEALNSRDGEVSDYKCNLVGVLFVPKVLNMDIPPEWEEGITFPKFTNHIINIVAVGEKP